ncbi:DciA family protein [Streptomyces celluloflavus]|uniref:DciA family protein n=1 Tax=Streptomyces celluloflavus TaxID=58344 RepID=UPI0036DF8A6D
MSGGEVPGGDWPGSRCGAAVGALVTERAREHPAADDSLRGRRAALAPDLAGHVTTIGFAPDSGRLTVCSESSAWTTKARLEQTRGIEVANAAADRTIVRALRILPPGAVPTPAPVRADAVPDGLGQRAGGGAAGRRAFAEPDVAPVGGPAPIAAARTQRRRQTAATENRNGPDERHHRVLGAAR